MSGKHRLGALAQLLGRYAEVFVHYWKLRKSMSGPLLNVSESEFLPAALALQERPVSSMARWTARLLIALVACAVLWATLGKIDIVVSANGKIIPSGNTKTIASVDVAAVRALHVYEGTSVRKGDVLIELDSSGPDAEHDKASGDASVAMIQTARARALIEAIDRGVRPHIPRIDGIAESARLAGQSHVEGQYADFRAKLARIDGEVVRLSAALPLASQRAADYKQLALEHDVSEHAWLEKEQARIEMAGQLNNARNERSALIMQVKKEAYDALSEGEKAAASSRQDARRAGSHSELLQLKAPVDGTVQQLSVHTVGGVVPAAQPLMMIVPRESTVEVEAMLENKDVGFVQEGQRVAVKIEAFDYTRYGTVPATVTRISRDAIQDEKRGLIYSVRMSLERADLNVGNARVPLSPGMAVNAEIRTGTRRVIEYVMSPLLQHRQEALRER